MSYEFIKNINLLNFSKKSVLIIGSGGMTKDYCDVLKTMNINNVSIIGPTEKKVTSLCEKYGFTPLVGKFEDKLLENCKYDLVVVCTPIHLLLPAANLALEQGNKNILIEKPGSLYYDDLKTLSKKYPDCKIRIGYQRIFFPNFIMLKELALEEGGIKSCYFDFTEWIHTINFKNNNPDAYQRWGISNSLHVISMAFDLIGFPKDLSAYRTDKLDWHPSGAIFVGSGLSDNDIPFVYHANWKSGGRWMIEVTTKKYRYRLMPLEELHRCSIGSVNWEKLNFKKAFPDVKQGLAEEIASMLSDKVPNELQLITLEKAVLLNKLAEKIFGYS